MNLFKNQKKTKQNQKTRHFRKMLWLPQLLPQWLGGRLQTVPPTPADFPGRHISLKETPVGAFWQEEIILHKGTVTGHELNHH